MTAEIAKSFYKICTITLVFVALASTELLAKKQSPTPAKKSSKDSKASVPANVSTRATRGTRVDSLTRTSQTQSTKSTQALKPHAGFVGIELGISRYRQDNKITLTSSDSSRNFEDYRYSRNTLGTNVGILSGYRGFFTSWFGLRAYANLNYTQTMDSNSFYIINYRTNPPTITNLSYDYSLSVLNYGANLDLLFNVLTIKESKLGIFAGGGIGGNTIFTNKAIVSAKKNMGIDKDALYDEIKDGAFTGLDAWVNCGFYGIFLKSHSIEVFAKIPFIPLQAHNSTRTTPGIQNRTIHFTNTWNVNVRYVFAF